MEITTIGVDLAKNVFQVHGMNAHGKAVVRKRLSRENFWARHLQALGHDARLISPQ
jgi:transposase